MRFFSLAISVFGFVASSRASLAQGVDDSRLRNTVTVLGGALLYAYGDSRSPFISAGIGRSLSRFVELEGTASYARLTTTFYSFTPTITSYDVRTPFLAADVGTNFMLPLGPFVPYVGLSVGAFRRNAINDASGVSSPSVSGTSLGGAVGARFLFGRRMGVRGELRYRQDSHQGFNSPANDVVESFGLIYRF
jgi:hypothetical protein